MQPDPIARTSREPLAIVPVLAIAGGVTLLLLLLSQWHGFHRDELYFIVAGRHPAFGYPDQPPLTPLLSAAATALLGVEPFAVRVLPAISAGLATVFVAGIARDMGGSQRDQIVGAGSFALSGLLAAGHLGSTATYELVLWTALMWLVVRLLDGGDARLWLAVGLIAGLALQNKQTALILGVGLAAGILLARRWDVLRSPWLWLGGLLAVAIWSPNAVWQLVNGLPQLEMASRIAQEATENRLMLLPELLLLAGPLLFPVLLAGLWWLVRAPEARPWRAIAYGFVVILGLVLLTGGKSYYAAGLFGPLMAAGGIAVASWLGRGRVRVRGTALAVVAACSGVLMAVITLPVVPPPMLARTPIPELYPESAEQVGWPELVSSVRAAADSLDPDERAATIVFTLNYGEAGAVELLGRDLPPVYSGHNGYGDWGPPSEEATIAIMVGPRAVRADRGPLGWCARHGEVDNGIDLSNEEQGAGIWICRDRPASWESTWEQLRHLN
ncbi:MAG: glycosyltransferase family 39 protein [Chloroflexota bacterium]|jgi:hypothetical protein